jgi:hypothetical protein
MSDQSLGVEADATVPVRHSDSRTGASPANCAVMSLAVPSELSGATSTREAGGSSR